MFPLKTIEAQLTAGNDGDYYKAHLDTDGNTADFRALTCIYYFFREPKGFSGGGLRLYDKIDYGGRIQQAETFQEIQPVSNRLLVFSSENYHELRPIRCPSRELADSRFAVTTWFHKSGRPDPSVPFGWGHFRCGDVPAAFRSLEQAR
jgi:Rps23 Pro-64 3,4-dihydroxylase Tpa1-like proline 4-hydroxylase